MKHLLYAFALVFAVFQADSISGLWEGYYAGMTDVENPVQLELRLNGSRLEGQIITDAEKILIENGRFSERDKKIHFEVYYASTKSRYVGDGIVERNLMKGTWKHERDHGRFEFKRVK